MNLQKHLQGMEHRIQDLLVNAIDSPLLIGETLSSQPSPSHMKAFTSFKKYAHRAREHKHISPKGRSSTTCAV